MRIGPREASTRTRTRPVVAIFAFEGEASPRISPGCAETTPATVVSYGCDEAMTSFDAAGLRTTTVPAESVSAAGTHSATS